MTDPYVLFYIVSHNKQILLKQLLSSSRHIMILYTVAIEKCQSVHTVYLAASNR